VVVSNEAAAGLPEVPLEEPEEQLAATRPTTTSPARGRKRGCTTRTYFAFLLFIAEKVLFLHIITEYL